MTRFATSALISASLIGAGCSSSSSRGEQAQAGEEGPADADAAAPSSEPEVEDPEGSDGSGGTGGGSSPDDAPNAAGVGPAGGSGGVGEPGGSADDDDSPGPIGAAGAAADDDVADDDPDPPLPTECVPGVPATSQIPRLLNREYDAAIRDLLGITSLASAGGGPPSSLLVLDFDGPLDEASWQAYFNAAETIAIEVMAGPNAQRFVDCDLAASECLRSTIESFGRRAFRRPLGETEVERFLALADIEPGSTPTLIAETMLFAFLSSPWFITLPELAANVDATTAAFVLSDHEVATRLSLLVWGSIPDDELNAAADAGQLGTPELVLAQAQRMTMNREKTGAQLIGAHRAYAEIGDGWHWGLMDHDPQAFPAFSSREQVNPAMMAELDAFFEEVGFQGTFSQLFTSNVGFVSQATAPIYGLDAASFGTELARVELAGRPGFLTRVAFLASFSHYDSTAPMLRGAYLLRNVLDIDPGPPDPAAVVVELPQGDFLTNREYSDALTSPPECLGCHSYINPLGYVLEVYDAVGGAQTIDPRGSPIDGTAEVTLAQGVVKTITTPEELMVEIALAPAARRLYAEKWVSYTTKRPPNSSDACIVDGLSERLGDDSYPIRDVLSDLSQAASFRLRTAAE